MNTVMFTRNSRCNLLKNFPVILFAVFFGITSCGKDPVPETITPPSAPDTLREFTSFTVKKADGNILEPSELEVLIGKDSINITVPPLTDIKNLKVSFDFKGKSVTPQNNTVQDLSSPVTYTITAASGSSKQYVVEAHYPQPKGIVYIGTGDKKFYALNAATGAVRWSYTSNGSFAYSSPTYRDGVVYVGCIDNNVYAFNAMNGRLLWKYGFGTTGIESDAVIADSTVYVGCNDDYLVALNAVTGQPRWTYLTGANISSSPKIANGMVYFGSSDNSFYALNAKTGQLVWKYTTGAMINQSGASLVNGVLYFGSRDGYLYALNASDGSLKWKYSTPVSLEMSSPTVNNGIVYIGGWYSFPGFNIKGSVYAVNASTGALVWESMQNTGFSSSPFVNNGRLFITGDDGNISVLNAANGSVYWQKTIYANSASPVEANGIVYVGGGGTNNIYAFNAVTGNEIWRFPIPLANMASSPLVIDPNGVVDYPGDSGAMD
ncbi:MAG: PQQ-binding-like beta-propeller repeat protein [Ferruginibacter sp.]